MNSAKRNLKIEMNDGENMNPGFLEVSSIIMVAFFLGFLFAVLSGALFAYIVFRCKREPHESLFKVGAEKGDAFVLDDYGPGVEDIPTKERGSKDDPVPSIMAKQTEKFLQQLRDKTEAGKE
jgi:hypothetical protein